MPDLTRTRRNLVEQALMNLGVLASGQPAENEDVDRVNGLVDPTLAMLAASDIYYVAYDEEIPIEAFLALAAVLANAAKASFGRAGDAALQAEAEQAKYELKCISRPAGGVPLLRTDPVLRAGIVGANLYRDEG
jgi:hypothetical protein